jgi:hypothetical protein
MYAKNRTQMRNSENSVYLQVMQYSGSKYTTISQEFSLKKRPFQTGIADEVDEAYQNI